MKFRVGDLVYWLGVCGLVTGYDDEKVIVQVKGEEYESDHESCLAPFTISDAFDFVAPIPENAKLNLLPSGFWACEAEDAEEAGGWFFNEGHPSLREFFKTDEIGWIKKGVSADARIPNNRTPMTVDMIPHLPKVVSEAVVSKLYKSEPQSGVLAFTRTRS